MKKHYPSFKEVYDSVSQAANWQFVFDNLAPSLGPAIVAAQKSSGTPGHVKCPFPDHGGENDFRFNEDWRVTGRGICSCCQERGVGPFDILYRAGYFSSTNEAKNAVAQLVGLLEDYEPSYRKPDFSASEFARAEREKKIQSQNAPEQVERRRRFQTRLCYQAFRPDHPKAEPLRKYFDKRGIPLRNLKNLPMWLHPGLVYKEKGQEFGPFPCILIEVSLPNGERCTLHRIYITEEGEKAPIFLSEGMSVIQKVKRILPQIVAGTLNGAAIRLATVPGCTTLNLAEGPETAYAAHLATGETAWAGYSSTVMANVEIPRYFKRVRIWADLDRSHAGSFATVKLMNRLLAQGFEVEVMMPRGPIPEGYKGIDWLDIIVQTQVLTLPQSQRMVLLRSLAEPMAMQAAA